MRFGLPALAAIAFCGTLALAEPSAVSKIYDQDLTSLEREIVPLAEAMPADKYNFAPTNGEFTGVRTFGEQMKYVAAVIYLVLASVLAEKNPDTGGSENGPASAKSKDPIVKYLKDSFAYAHKAMRSLTEKNATELVRSAFGSNQIPRLSMASVAAWHSFDRYGQAVVYARMTGVVPPASRK